MANITLLFLCFLQTGCFVWVARFFSLRLQEATGRNAELQVRIEALQAEWRQSDRELYDRLMTAYAAKLPDAPAQQSTRYEQERVVKLPDPELLDLFSPDDRWFHEDRIKEEIEYRHPELAMLDIDVLKRDYTVTWQDAEKRLRDVQMPLRA